MAILTVEDFQASREAINAGVAEESEAEIEEAIDNAEANLNLLLGYKVSTDDTEVTARVATYSYGFVLPQYITSLIAVTEDGNDVDISEAVAEGFRFSNPYALRGTVVIEGTFGFEEGTDYHRIARQWVLKAAVDELLQTSSAEEGGTFPPNVEGINAEGVSIRFGPERRPDLADLLTKLPKHPGKSNGLYTISTTRGELEVHDGIWEALQRTK